MLGTVKMRCLFALILLAGMLLCARPLFGETQPRATAEVANQTGIIWNNTDLNTTYPQASYTGSQALVPRIIMEYADDLVTFHMRYAPDINIDGKVNIIDISIVARAFNSVQGLPYWKLIADINGDGKVNIMDITMVAIHFGEHYTIIYP